MCAYADAQVVDVMALHLPAEKFIPLLASTGFINVALISKVS
jgi:hypothetical protein